MLFTKHRSVVSSGQPMPMITTNSNISMMPKMSYTDRTTRNKPPIPAAAPVESEPTRGKKIWGPSVWLFFHSFAEKIKPEYFSTTGKEFIAHIVNICNNLPCPECAMHASAYMQKIQLNSIQTKDDLIKMLYVFHNQLISGSANPNLRSAI